MSATTKLFGTDGVRGIAGKPPLVKPFVRRLGAAAALVYRQHVKNRSAVFLIGRDTRRSGAWLVEAFAAGVRSQGLRVRDAGVVSTPSLAYLVPKRRVWGGAMVSASHNPAEFNGIKLFSPSGRKCPDAWERQIEQRLVDLADVAGTRGRLEKDAKAIPDYLRFLRQTLPARASLRGLTLVVDCSHGSLSRIAPSFLRSIGAKVIAIGARPNGRNINAGWGSQYPERMQQEVLRRKAYGGLAFDGDADRIVMCDEHGQLLDGDFIIACAARFLKEEKRLPTNTVVVTVMANLGLLKALESWNIKTLTTPVGDRFVSEKLEEHGAAIGGEQSGHIIFHRHLPTGDGLLTGLQVLSMLRQRELPLSYVTTLFQKYPQVLINVHVKEKKPLEHCPPLQSEITRVQKELADQGRVFVRYSGTEPLLRIMMEGPDH
ncbi:MAG TPA: phosphoglucosamine mutase, partial [Elusimicrobiota bacterium]|nr:phosphoglucosamine mutase [Elusimicrobiota bacterium]